MGRPATSLKTPLTPLLAAIIQFILISNLFCLTLA